MSNVTIIASHANKIRALHAVQPQLSVEALAAHFMVQPRAVRVALGQGDKRRVKSRTAASGRDAG